MAHGDDGCAIAIDPTSVYWGEGNIGQMPGKLMKVSKMGGTPVEIASTPGEPCGVAVDATNVYWTTLGMPGMAGGTVMKAPLDGGPLTTLASAQAMPAPIVVLGTTVYWLDSGTTGMNGALMSVPTTGGTPTQIASGLVNATGLAVNALDAYWSQGTGTLWRAPLSGGMPAEILSTDEPTEVLLDTTNLYWLGPSAIMTQPLAGGPVSSTPTNGFQSFAMDQTSFYGNAGGTLVKVPIGGDTSTVLAYAGVGGQPYALMTVAVDATSVYWIARFNSNDVIFKTSK